MLRGHLPRRRFVNIAHLDRAERLVCVEIAQGNERTRAEIHAICVALDDVGELAPILNFQGLRENTGVVR